MIFPPVRDKEIVKAEAVASLAECRAIEDKIERGIFFCQNTRPLITEYHAEVLDTFETETKAVRIIKHGGRYFVSTFEIFNANGVSSSIQGHLFFGGTEDADEAWSEYKETVERYKP